MAMVTRGPRRKMKRELFNLGATKMQIMRKKEVKGTTMSWCENDCHKKKSMWCVRRNCLDKEDFAKNMERKRSESKTNSGNNESKIPNSADFKIALASIISAEGIQTLNDQFSKGLGGDTKNHCTTHKRVYNCFLTKILQFFTRSLTTLVTLMVLFTYLIDTENDDETHDFIDILRSANITLATHAKVYITSAINSILWFKIKITAFHSIMLTNYLAFQMRDWTKSKKNTVLLGLLHPIIPHAHPITYWITIYLSIHRLSWHDRYNKDRGLDTRE